MENLKKNSMIDHSEENDAIDKFRDILSHWINVYTCKLCSYFAVKTIKGSQLVLGQVLYETETPKNAKPNYYFENDHIIAGHEITSIETKDIEQLLFELKKGSVPFLSYTFSLKSKSGEIPNFTFYPVYPPAMSYGPRIPTLIATGKERHNFFTVDSHLLNWELKSADQPFDSIEDLLSHIRLPALSQIGDYPKLEVWGRSPAHISQSSTINNGKALIAVDMFKNLDVSKIKLGLKVFKKTDTERFSVNADKIDLTENENLIIGNYRLDVEDATWLQAFLSYDDLALHSWFINDIEKQINHRYSIHHLFDENLEITRKYLLELTKNPSEDFEYGVASLLHVLGFSVLHYGQIPKLKDGPDIVAYTPIGNIAVIECTIGPLDKEDKLTKLIQRTVLIKDKLGKIGFGHFSIQPIIVSKFSKAEVSGDLEKAGKHGIAVVCKEELTELLNRVNSYPNPEGLFREASRLIPKTEQLSLPDLNNE